MSIPCGAAAGSGLPIALQLVGKPFDEPAVLKVADAYQRRTEWHLRVPNLAKIGMMV
jgi:aspartyl-tRNA(Asn)/glutamyl-tRNA(Gln) amidotransferase subunit A